MSRRNHFHRSQRRQYASRSGRENPFYARKRKGRPKFLILIACLVLLATVFAIALFFLRSPRFALSAVRVEGNETVAEEEIFRLVSSYLDSPKWVFFRNSNRFLFDSLGIETILSGAYAFDSLTTAVSGSRLTVTVREKAPALLWQTRDLRYLVDEAGKIIRVLGKEEIALLSSPDAEPEIIVELVTNDQGETVEVQRLGPIPEPPPLKRLPRFFDLNEKSVRAGEAVLTPEEAGNILRLHELLGTQGIGFSQTSVDRLAGKWMAVRTLLGYDILFDPTGDIGMQAENLAITLRERIPDPSALKYIDLRFGDHVYFK